MPQEQPTPDRQAILQHLQHITRRWHELDEAVLLEIVHLTAGDKAEVRDVSHYRFPDQIDAAADHVAGMNPHKLNAYATVNPVAEAHRPPAGRRANADSIAASFYHWADADSAEAAANIKSFVGPKPTFTVITGRHPCTRPHVYWELNAPTSDWVAWTATQKNIAATLHTDPAVVDPPRIMRIAGTVNWPKPQKQAKGYVAETTELRILKHPPVTADAMARAFVGAQAPAQAQDWIDQDDRPATSVDAYTALLRGMGTDGEKHAKVRDATAKMAAAGVPRNMTEAIVRSYCPVWDENVQNLIETAYAKFYRAPESLPEAKVPLAVPFMPWQPIDAIDIPPRDFIYGRHYIRKFASVTVAPGGLGKSTLVLAECIAIATGKPILGIAPKERARVVYFNAEDPLDEIQRRVVAMCQHHGIPQTALAGWLYTASGRDSELILSTGEQGDIVEPVFDLIETWAEDVRPAVIAFDPLANMTESPETNDVFRRLGKRLSRMADKLNCSIELVHHTRKLNGKEAEIEDSRGGGALLGAVRAGRVLNPMTAEEAAKAGLETHIDHFRIEAAGKNNLARPAAHAEWLQRISVDLMNGDSVAAIEKWNWPDAFDGISRDDARRVQLAVAAAEADPPRLNMQSAQWIGHLVAKVLNFDSEDKADKARINQMVKAWVKSEVLTIEDMRDSRAGRDVKVILAGPNNPAADEN